MVTSRRMRRRLVVLAFQVTFACATLFSCSDGGSVQDPGPQPLPTQPPVAKIELSGARPILLGEVLQLSALTLAANEAILTNRPIAWASSDTAIAKVSASGSVTANARTGTATITASAEGVTGSIPIPVWRLYRSPSYTTGASDERIVTVFDSARGRSVSVSLWAPSGAPGPLPIAIYARSSLAPGGRWATLMASAGYAVIKAPAPIADESSCASFGIPVSECADVLRDQTGVTGGAISTLVAAREASAVRDNLDAIERASGVDLDLTRVGLIGMSRGAASALALAGATYDLSPSVKAVSVRDARFDAVLALSPPGTTSTAPPCGCSASSWTTIVPVPLMVQTSTADEWGRRESYDVMTPGSRHLAFFSTPTIGHLAFGLEWAPLPVKPGPMGDYISVVGIAFLDAYLKNSADAKAWLKSDELARGTNSEVLLSNK